MKLKFFTQDVEIQSTTFHELLNKKGNKHAAPDDNYPTVQMTADVSFEDEIVDSDKDQIWISIDNKMWDEPIGWKEDEKTEIEQEHQIRINLFIDYYQAQYIYKFIEAFLNRKEQRQ